jgi:hypothetical protein
VIKCLTFHKSSCILAEGGTMNKNIPLIAKRSNYLRSLKNFNAILPGSISTRFMCCGKPNCVCKREGKKHLAFHYSCKIGDKIINRMIPHDLAPEVQKQVDLNKKLKNTLKQIHEINLQILFDKIANHSK